jgi:hypothetical protein
MIATLVYVLWVVTILTLVYYALIYEKLRAATGKKVVGGNVVDDHKHDCFGDKKNLRVVRFNFASVLENAHGVGFDTMTVQCDCCGSTYRCKGRRSIWSVEGKLIDSRANYILIALREVTG